MQNEPEIIEAKPWVYGGEGTYPSRVVLLKWSETKFSTHWQIDPSKDSNKEPYFIMGNYFDAWGKNAPEDALRKAQRDFLERDI